MNFLTKATEFLRSQWSGILTGMVIMLIGLLGKYVWNFIISIPNYLFSHKMQKSISKTINLANEEIGLPLIPEVELKVVKSDTPMESLQNKLLIFVKKENKPKVYANVITQILNESFLRDARRHIDINSFETTKYTMGKSLITEDKPVGYLKGFTRDALKYYDRKMEEKILTKDATLRLVKKEESILIKRLFKTVLLQELYAIGEKMVGTIPSTECKEESRQFIDFLYDIARKDKYKIEKGEEPPLKFIKTYFKVGLVLVKRQGTVDLANHLLAVRNDIKNGAISIYVMGWGRENVRSIEKDFAEWLRKIAVKEYSKQWKVEKIIKYKLPMVMNDRDIPGICCIFRHKSWLPQ